MKKLRVFRIVIIVNILLVCNGMGMLRLSEDIIAASPDSAGLSAMNLSRPTRLTFTSNGGVLETQIAKRNEQYVTAVRFVESDSEAPILSAVINIRGDIAKADYSSDERLNSGIYNIYITPKLEERLSFQIEASKNGYSTSVVRLVLSVGLLPSELLFSSSNQSIRTSVVEINTTYTTNVTYLSSGKPVNNANIEVRSVLDPNVTTELTQTEGVYRINITLSEIEKNIYIGIAASADGIATSSVDLILTTIPIQAKLQFTSNGRTTETNPNRLNVNETYTTKVKFTQANSPETFIDGALLILVYFDPGITYNVTALINGTYQIDIRVNVPLDQSRQVNINIEASKIGFSNATATLTLIVHPIPAFLVVDDPDIVGNRLEVIYKDPIEVTIQFQDENGSSLEWDDYVIDSGDLTVLSLTPGDEHGQYVVQFNASSPRIYSTEFIGYKRGYEDASLKITIQVSNFSIELRDPADPKSSLPPTFPIPEDQPKNLTLLLWNPHLNTSIVGATITYKLMDGDVEGVMEERENGIYFVDLSDAGLTVQDELEPYKFQVTVTKEHYFTKKDTLNIVIEPTPSYIVAYVLGGTIVSFGVLLGYEFRRRSQKQKNVLIFEERKAFWSEIISDILHFQDLLVVSENADIIYGYQASTAEAFGKKTLDSSFLMALKTFSGESIILDELKGEDHFRFGETEIFLISGEIGIFAFLFEVQIINDEWKRVSSEMLGRCREVVAAIEFEFQEPILKYLSSQDPNVIPKDQISYRVTGILELDVGLPHELTGKDIEFETSYPDPELIIWNIEELKIEKGNITAFNLQERLGPLGIPTEETFYIFYQLRKGAMIVPVERDKKSIN